MKNRLLLLLFVFFWFVPYSFGQDQDSVSHKATSVYLEHSDLLSYDKEVKADAQILKGNVCFRHDSSYMYCDSAYFYEDNNSLEAFSNVRMEQGDTLFVYGDYLIYEGNIQLARLRNNVRMVNNQVTLYTDSLNYDRTVNVGYYFDGGKIVDEENVLSSFLGKYSPDTKIAVFNDSVKLDNPQFVLTSDTLEYSTDSKIATILGPSVIVSDSGTIYTSKGWYDTVADKSLLLDRSVVVSGNRLLTGDSIAYNKNAGLGEAFGNMSIRDTVQKVILEGNYGYYNELTEYAFATDSARFLEYSGGDTLYLHADTLEMVSVDSVYREVKAFYGVRFYRTDFQGVCDSLQLNTRDSVLYMFREPILWNEQYQILGDTILIFMGDSAIDYAHVKEYAFSSQYIDSTYYNQLKGSDLKAYFEGETVKQIDIAGNAEMLYYPIEKDGSFIGLNETKSGFLNITLNEGKLERLVAKPMPVGVLTPIPDLNPEQKFLKDFKWHGDLRPKDKNDIFTVHTREAQSDVPKRSNKFVH
nr:OstA-like protein [Massilibacteroides sp.]